MNNFTIHSPTLSTNNGYLTFQTFKQVIKREDAVTLNKRLTLGAKRQTSVTLALSEMVTAMLVTRRGTWLAVPKYSGTNASQITHVVYIVNPA